MRWLRCRHDARDARLETRSRWCGAKCGEISHLFHIGHLNDASNTTDGQRSYHPPPPYHLSYQGQKKNFRLRFGVFYGFVVVVRAYYYVAFAFLASRFGFRLIKVIMWWF